MNKIISVLVFFISLSVNAQMAIGDWNTHYSYYNTSILTTDNDENLYAVSNNKLYGYNFVENKFIKYSKITGLNSDNVNHIGFCNELNKLVIIYKDGDIDLLNVNGEVENISDYKNKIITADKTIIKLKIIGKYAYLCSKIGIIVVDIEYGNILNVYKVTDRESVDITDIDFLDDYFYVATSDGFFKGNNNYNLSNYNVWEKVNFLENKKVKNIVNFNNELFVLADDNKVYKGLNSWIKFSDFTVDKIKSENGLFILLNSSFFHIYNKDLDELLIKDLSSIKTNDLTYCSNKNILFHASNQGISSFIKGTNGFIIDKLEIKSNSPTLNHAWDGFYKDGTFYTITGGRWGDRFLWLGDIMKYEDGLWSKEFIDQQYYIDSVGAINKGVKNYGIRDILSLAIDPYDDTHMFFSTWGEGVFELKENKFYKLHSLDNSTLVSALDDNYNYVRVDGCVFDEDNNLWVLNSFSKTPINILDENGSWHALNYYNMPKEPVWNKILFASNNLIWCNSVRFNGGLFIIDNNGTTFDTSDDETKYISNFKDQDGLVYSPLYYNCVTEDLDGAIWIGTDKGPFVAYSPSNVFSNDFYFTRIKIPRNDGTHNADYLLKDIRINSIAVDGANRKWIGTNDNGIYVVSKDGLKTIYHFDSDNSPLPSNIIESITINPKTGEVMIGTEQGIVSYMSEVTQAKTKLLSSNVHVYPNPVKPNYNGKIAVKGLSDNAQIRITNLEGNVIVSGYSSGGEFVWNGLSRNGDKLSSGIYMVLVVDADGNQSVACKFMVIK